MSGDLIDTTEMYLKTVYELEEEGVPALRARIVERLGQSGPTVSETVARLERDGLLRMGAGRQIHFTDEGFRRAEGVMRRHRLAERLLTDVIGVEWVNVHDEACRWEHVVSDSVADKIEKLLHDPECDPFGNPIPKGAHAQEVSFGGSCESDVHAEAEQTQTLAGAADNGLGTIPDRKNAGSAAEMVGGDVSTFQCYSVVRIAERVQTHSGDVVMLDEAGFRPGVLIELADVQHDEIWVRVICAAGSAVKNGVLCKSESTVREDRSFGEGSSQAIAIPRCIAEGIYVVRVCE